MDASLFGALAEPSRFQIVELLQSGPMTVGEIGERLEMRQPQASKHLKVLLEAGVVEVQAEANRRIYRLRKEPFEEMEVWLKAVARIWEERFDQLEEYLLDLQQQGKQPPDKGQSK